MTVWIHKGRAYTIETRLFQCSFVAQSLHMKEEEGSGDSEQDVGSTGMPAEPIRLQSHYDMQFVT